MVESRTRPLVLVHLLVALLVMVLTSFLPSGTPTTAHNQHLSRHDDQQQKKQKKKRPPAQEPPPSKSTAASSSSSSWHQLKSLLSCRSATAAAVVPHIHDPLTNKLGRTTSACGASICAIRDVVHGNTRVVHRSDTDLSSVSDAGSMSQRETAPLARSVNGRSARHAQPVFLSGCGGAYTRGAALPLRKLSGCAEWHAVSVEPSSRRYPRPRELCACQQCGEVFTKSESLELHQAIRHAVSELGPEDSGRNIVEIIFKSSWQKKDRPIVQIERILKVHNAPRTVARFEDYRSSIKSHALLLHHLAAGGGAAVALRQQHHQPLPSSQLPQQKKNPRCAADGNELLRFHCTALSCSLGARGSTSLCANSSSSSATPCAVCTIIRHGFAKSGGHLQHHPLGVRTTASSGRAHDHGPPAAGPGELRAMLVCRVIAGRIRRPGEESPSSSAAAAAATGGAEDGGYDSLAGEVEGGVYGNLEELFVANPRAILPCFVVIYRALD